MTPSPAPTAQGYLGAARAAAKRGDWAGAVRWCLAVTDDPGDFPVWLAAAGLWQRSSAHLEAQGRPLRVAVVGSYTTSQYAALLPLALARTGIRAVVHEGGYGQYRQDLLDPGSPLAAFGPDVVVIAAHAGELHLPAQSDGDLAQAVDDQVGSWTVLWERAAGLGARVVQHNFAIDAHVGMGHLAARRPGSRYWMLQEINRRLAAEAAARGVLVLDCERLSGLIGKRQWFDARYFHLAKLAVGLAGVPLLVQHTAAVVAGDLGLARKCVVVDLDGTLWGGVVGEVGPAGIQVGEGAVGEAFSAFQQHLLELRQTGVILAVCSKNNELDAREAFSHPGMVLALDDVADFAAGWEDKPAAIRGIADRLGIGLSSMVFVDDNPAEREAVRRLLPEVDVIPLPPDPGGYVAALAAYPFFERSAITEEDAARTDQYRARAAAAALRSSATSVADFLAGLEMTLTVGPLTAANLARVAQLIGKTNQWNVTVRRRTPAEVEALIDQPGTLVLVAGLTDRFADHGLIGVLVGQHAGVELDIDTWLLSCRVIGRTVEDEMLRVVAEEAAALGVTTLTGTYVPAGKNGVVADLYERLGFDPVACAGGRTTWRRTVDGVGSPGLMAVRRAALRR